MSDRQRRFCEEYLKDLIGTQAAIRAGYSHTSARETACELLAKSSIQRKIQLLKAKREERTNVTMDKVVLELARLAFGTSKSVMKWGPHGLTLIDSKKLTDDDAAIVAEVTQTTTKDGGSIKLRTHDKVRALEQLAKHLTPLVPANNGPAPARQIRVIIEDYKREPVTDRGTGTTEDQTVAEAT